MPLIDVDPSELLRVATSVDSSLAIGDRVSSPNSSLEAGAGAAGRGDVEGAIRSFLQCWSYGMNCVNQDARRLSSLLRLAGDAYTRADQAVETAADQ